LSAYKVVEETGKVGLLEVTQADNNRGQQPKKSKGGCEAAPRI
jgi:hypothetical protein